MLTRYFKNVQLVRSFLISCLLVFILVTDSSVLSSEINLTRSKVIQLALHLEAAEPELRYEFAQIALIEMYNSYQKELKKSRDDLPENAKKRAKIRRWRYATHSYLESLDQLFLLMDSEMPLDYFISPQNKIILLIAEQPVIISGPNSGANKQIETNIVAQFCQSFDCTEYFAETLIDKERLKKTAEKEQLAAITGSWSIKYNMQADFITSNQIVFNFINIKNRQEKERWALNVTKELVQLIQSLKLALDKGNLIHWSTLMIHELPVTDNAYKININSDGDYIKASLPLTGTHKSLFEQLKPWIISHFGNQQVSRTIIKNADSYFKP